MLFSSPKIHQIQNLQRSPDLLTELSPRTPFLLVRGLGIPRPYFLVSHSMIFTANSDFSTWSTNWRLKRWLIICNCAAAKLFWQNEPLETDNKYYEVSETSIKDLSMLGTHSRKLCNNVEVHWMTQTCRNATSKYYWSWCAPENTSALL